MICLTFAVGLSACGGDESGRKTLRFYGGTENSGALAQALKDCSTDRYKLSLEILPPGADDQREQLVRRLAAKDSAIDLINMDVIWVPEFAEAGWVKEWTGANREEATKGVLKGPLDTAIFDDKLYGAPYNSNTQLLWYRKDRVKTPPRTWAQMIEQAKQIGADGKVLVQGAQYEGLTVWFNSLLESAGGAVLKDATTVDLAAAPTKAALEVMKQTTTVGDPSLSTQKEDESRLAFQKGGASFMVNYPFIYPSAKDEAPEVFKQIGWADYPVVKEGEPTRAPLGGYNIGVGAYTESPDDAFEAALCIRNERNQKNLNIKSGLPPTLASLYDDPEVKKANPYIGTIRRALETPAIRPETPAYNDVSLAIQKTLSPPSSIDPNGTPEKLRQRVEDALNSKGLL
ncbi:MAG TPA: ABC transporter substrate-binding protein [Baekduia sp.]|nr:ABC transporter substrate-binding protein [Baekduia sp.]